MPFHTPFIRLMKSKNATSLDLTVDTYPSPTEDVLPVFCLDKLNPAIYHPVLLTSTLPSLSSSSSSHYTSSRSSLSASSRPTQTGDNISDDSFAFKTASQIHLHSGSVDATVSYDERDDVPCLVDGVDPGDGGSLGVLSGGRFGRGMNGDGTADGLNPDEHGESARVPAVSSTTRQRSNSQPRMPRGDSGRGSFAQACKKYDGKWEEAEWSDRPSVPKGAGIPGVCLLLYQHVSLD